ncbi:MAG TPA: ATP-binding protein [Burkholderiales bacterium]|nr:ATP-binding protein [Burkholderiales bacterium]
MKRLETTIRNTRAELTHISTAVDRFAANCGLSKDVVADLQVALNEVLTNIIDYGYTDVAEHEIRICLEVSGDVLEAAIEDDGVAFDPLRRAAPDLNAPLRERRVGGLGIHFVKNLMNETHYDRVGDRNRLVLRKRLRV